MLDNHARNDCPLYVDLDGSLTPSDTLHESAMLFVREDPLNLLRMLAWLPRGKAGFKRALADAVQPDPARLPWREDFVQFLRDEHARGRTLVLASAADVRVGQRVAEHLGVFSAVLGTADGEHNLSRTNKREAIAAHARALGHEHWAYAGNSTDDLSVWEGASQAIAVNAPAGVLRRLRQRQPVAHTFEHHAPSLKTLLRAIRLKQWSKNGLIFLPLLAAHSLDPALWLQVFVAFVAFGLCASATYLFNDLLDLPNDRVHRIKRLRPLAAGAVTIQQAVVLGAVMIVAAFGLALWVGWPFTAVLALYTALTLAYSMRWKRIALFDVLLLAALYTLRIGAGAVAASVDPSNWLLAISVFLFLSLALVKRCAELEEAMDDRRSLAPGRGYQPRDLPSLRSMGMSSGFMAVLVLALYIDSPNSRALYAQPDVLWAASPVLLLWIMRIWLKTGRRELHGEDPLAFALKDPFSWVTLAVMIGIGVLATVGI
ncbi:UbiA family prenyltransferase [Hydrogenophaga intermedia]|jgi:4-hydroxybenzoate polyprenyltransferase/phosphoserine phosphatase|uniref:UbiA family prenyltransferase n=1 Tax=Hydrogenophaga intermedia TaxID=65786 RepID=UPI0020447E58|nr:UbiA family prenyltransferase [Hydrogenophaga intermedia]MCM3563579.1 UbiA family prenyltransferase [Hydrogenophaga intermedia]